MNSGARAVECDARDDSRDIDSEARGGHRRQRSLATLGQLDHDLVEAQRVVDSVTDGLQHGLDVIGFRKPRRDLEHALEHALVLDVLGGVLGDLERQRGVARDRHERVQLRLAGPQAALGLVDRYHAQDRAAGVAQRNKEGVAGQPGVGVVARRQVGDVGGDAERVPVELAVEDEVGAAMLEAVSEQRRPGVVR